METFSTKLLLCAAVLATASCHQRGRLNPPRFSHAATPSQQQPPASSATGSDQQQQPADPNAPADDSVLTIRVPTNEVNVVFTVTDKHGRRVTDLKQGDFSVVDDNKPPQEIRSFHAETNLPLQVGLLIDASNSVRDRFKFDRNRAIEFLNQTIHPRPTMHSSSDSMSPQKSRRTLPTIRRNSHTAFTNCGPAAARRLYDAIYFACRDKLLKTAKGTPVRRAIILLTMEKTTKATSPAKKRSKWHSVPKPSFIRSART